MYKKKLGHKISTSLEEINIFRNSKTCPKRPLKHRQNKCFNTHLLFLMKKGSLVMVESIADCSPWSILRLSGRLRQVYCITKVTGFICLINHGIFLSSMCTSCNRIVNLNIDGSIKVEMSLSLYLIEMPFNAFANRADPDQAALARAA